MQDSTHAEQLVVEIAEIQEKAYRRGVQQGFLIARGRMLRTPTESEIANWRIRRNRNRYATRPPGSPREGQNEDLIERLKMELLASRHPIVRSLLDDLDQPRTRDGEEEGG